MSERGVDVNISDLSEAELLELAQKKRAERKAKLVTILDRGLVGDRLQVPLPPDKYGEWVPNDKMEIYRMESMGYKVDTEYAKNRALHSDGTEGKSIVADVVYMVCDKEQKELIDEINLERYNAANNPKGGKQKEERQFEQAAREAGLPVDEKQHSRVDSTNIEAIKAALSVNDS